jgi:DNA adenine methylase
MNKRESFTLQYAIRLQKVDIECADALRIIRSRDTKDTFFYCDPPYVGSDCGHYDGYSIEDYQMLLEYLANIEGKFLLSSYPSDLLNKFRDEHQWEQREIEMAMNVNAKSMNRKARKTEVVTANYSLDHGQQELF